MKVKKLVLTAILSALSVVLSEFLSIKIPPTSTLFTLSLGIIPIFFIAYYCGVIYSSIAAIIIDILGMVVVGSSFNQFYIGFTLNAFLSGLFLGLSNMLKNKISIKTGKLIFIILELLVTVITIPIFIVFFNKFGLDAKYDVKNIVYIISGCAIGLNVITILYSLFFTKDKDAVGINIGYLLYQVVVSLCLTPLWLYDLYKTNYIFSWAKRLISVPILLLIYAVLTRIILRVLKKIRKEDSYDEK